MPLLNSYKSKVLKISSNINSSDFRPSAYTTNAHSIVAKLPNILVSFFSHLKKAILQYIYLELTYRTRPSLSLS